MREKINPVVRKRAQKGWKNKKGHGGTERVGGKLGGK